MSAVLRATGVEAQAYPPAHPDEVQAALLDPVTFTHEHCWIESGPAGSGKRERFRLWPSQRQAIAAMDDHKRLIFLKARQLGISWCSDAYILWLCTANYGQTVVIVSQGQDYAQEELRRIKFMHKNLPPELRRRLARDVPRSGAKENMSQLDFPDMGSRIISLAPTENTGSTYTASLVVVQELGKIANAGGMMTSLNPLVGDGGRLHIVSTAKGYSGVYYDLWRQAETRLSSSDDRLAAWVGATGLPGEYVPVFIPWHARPGRDDAWYESMSRTMPEKSMRQEYPATPTEAFQGSTDAVFTDEFDRTRVAIPGRRDPSNTHPVYGGIDPGISTGCGYLMEAYGRNVFIFHEVWLQNRTVPEMGAAMYAAMVEERLDPAEVVCHMDPFDVGRNLQTGQTDLDVLSEAGLLMARSAPGSPEAVRFVPAQRVSLIKTLLKQQRIYVSTACPHLLDALERAPWATGRASTGEIIRLDSYAKDGVHEHPLDAAGAALVRIFPPFAAAAVDTIVGTAYAEHAAIGGSEFG